ncbi:MAG: MCE family protein [Actinomycetota bacterium]
MRRLLALFGDWGEGQRARCRLMRLDRKILVNLVVILMLGVLTVGWVVTRLIGSGGFDAPFRVTADFAASGGVFTNQEVTYRGVLVGQVGEMALNEDGVDIELLIDPQWAGKIPASVDAAVRSKSAVGEQFVNLTPAGDSADMLSDGDTIPRDQTSLPVDFQDLLRSLDLVLGDVEPETTRRLVSNLATGTRGHAGDIATILDSLGTLATGFASVAPEQRRLLDNATDAGTAFLETKDSFSRAIRAADQVFAGIGDEPEELERLFAANDRFARAGIALLARHGDDLAGGIGGLADFMSFQRAERETIGDTLTYVPQFLHAIEDASVLWRAPDGREFYRIRAGLILDNVPSSWPCKYRLPFEHERQAHVRTDRPVPTEQRCESVETATNESMEALVQALKTWARSHPAEELRLPARSPNEAPATIWDRPSFRFLNIRP